MCRLAKDTGVTYPTLRKLNTGRAQRNRLLPAREDLRQARVHAWRSAFHGPRKGREEEGRRGEMIGKNGNDDFRNA